MTAPPSIPNLFSLRGSRGGDGFRQRRGGAGGGVVTQSAAGHDATIQGTDTDAAVSRSSAVGLGYLHDPFAQYFVQNAFGPSSRRLPIINRGTYTRTAGLDVLVDRFLGLVDGDNNQRQGQKSQQKQIISLGAGTDTRSLRLLDKHSSAGIVYHEIDFPLICAKKLNIVKATPALRTLLTDPQVEDDGSWRCSTPNDGRFWCHGLDLRRLTSQQSDASADIKGLRTDVPTLLISECCLCYLQVPEAKSVIKWFSDRIPNLGIVIYEPTKPDDPFGKTMVSNLAARGISMPTLSSYRQPADQETRLRDAGFDIARHMTVDDIWSKWVAPEEKERVDRLEGLDEVEEWELLAGHYVVAWAWRGLGFEPWGQLR